MFTEEKIIELISKEFDISIDEVLELKAKDESEFNEMAISVVTSSLYSQDEEGIFLEDDIDNIDDLEDILEKQYQDEESKEKDSMETIEYIEEDDVLIIPILDKDEEVFGKSCLKKLDYSQN